ncbi:MAG TPA: DUF1552 domain-containing protein [Vicinamibacterales bacterium]|nr:DUF1552 domain-containing protein [Vicinamibacterales bacterium]
MFNMQKHLSRRTALKGIGVTLALPLLDAMVPAGRVWAKTAAGKTRLVCLEMPHGSAGSAPLGASKYLWAPAQVGRSFDLSTSSLSPLEPWRDWITIVSNTDVRGAEATALAETGGDHYRSACVFYTQSHPKQTQGSDVQVGTSMDQFYAQRFGQDTPIPSMQLCIEQIDQAGGCSYGYNCVYTDCISWASPTQPLPMIRDPRVAFDQLFGIGATKEERAARRQEDRSVLDAVTATVSSLKRDLGPDDRAKLTQYLDNVREVERRIQKVEAHNSSGEPRELPEAPIGVPDSFDEHVKLMFDLQALAFASDTTRIFSFKLGRDSSSRVYPGSGSTAGFHNASHHGEKEEFILDFAKINRHHVSLIPYLLDKLKNTPDGDSNLLENTVLIYGSPMGNSNVHNHKRVPLFLAGHMGGRLKGNLHLKAPDGTSMANVLLTVMHGLGLDDMASFGDSTGEFDLTSIPQTTSA